MNPMPEASREPSPIVPATIGAGSSDARDILTAVGEDFSLSHPYESGAGSSAVALLGGPALYLAGLGWMRAASSRIVPYAHVAGIALLCAAYLFVSNTTNFLIQLTVAAILLGVAIGEAAAVKWHGPRRSRS